MNNFFKFIKDTFSKKNNILFLILSFVISLLATVSLCSNRIATNKKYSYLSDFPENYSLSSGMDQYYKEKMNTFFGGLDYHCLRECSKKPIVNFSIGDFRFVLIGVDEDFLSYPLPSFNINKSQRTLEYYTLDCGENFTSFDIEAKSCCAIMNSYYLSVLGFDNDTLTINGKNFVIKGALSSSRTILKNTDSSSIQIPIYMPYTTLTYLMGSEDYYLYSCVIETNGYTFPDYDSREDVTFQSHYLIEKEKSAYESSLNSFSMLIVVSLFALALVSTFIVQYIMVRNKHYEIGIKRAIGASRTDIVFEFMSEFCLVTFVSVVIGMVFGVIVSVALNLQSSIVLGTSVIEIPFQNIIMILTAYYLFVILTSLFSIIMGAKTNIASIIVEER